MPLQSTQNINSKDFYKELSQDDLIDLIEQPAWKTILINLINSEKMDPWDIDLIVLADKYLQKINSLSQGNLRIPANAILCCAMLLKFKSKYLKFTDFDKEEKDIFSSPEFADLKDKIPVLTNPSRFKEGHITLNELVNVLDSLMEKVKVKKRNKVLKSVFLERHEKKEINFNIEINEVDVELESIKLLSRIKKSLDSQGITLFSHLVKGFSVIDIVLNFIFLLHLINSGRINAWQEQFFDEIFISLVV